MNRSFLAVGIDFRDTPLEWRGQASPKSETFCEEISPDFQERIWLSTCNRVEIYGVGSPEEGRLIVERWLKACGLPDEMRSKFHFYHGIEAVKHLFRVAASLESMVIGEAQILGQVKKAYEKSVSLGWAGPIVHKIFQAAFRSAKRVRSQTELGKLAVSIPSLGVKVAEKIVGDLSQRRVGILGLGEIGRVSAEHFASVQPAQIFLYNRTRSVAVEMAEALSRQGATAEVAESIEEVLRSCEVMVFAADREMIKEEHIQILKSRSDLTFILDLSVPATLPELKLESFYVFQIDDLKKMADENNQLRFQELSRADVILAEELEKIGRQLQFAQLDTTLAELSQKLKETTDRELGHLRKRLSHLTEEEMREIETMAHRLMTKFLQEPTVELRALLQSGEQEDRLLRFFRSLFRI